MIFVTVGMHNQGFDRLIEKCDLLAGQIEDKMIIQRDLPVTAREMPNTSTLPAMKNS